MARVPVVPVLGLVAALGSPAQGAGQLPEPLRAADALVTKVDAAERSEAAAMALEEELDPAIVAQHLTTVHDYLQDHPENATALVLSVRLGRLHDLVVFRQRTAQLWTDPAAGAPDPPSWDAYLGVLDRVLTRDSTVAEAHYWTARLLIEDMLLAAQAGATVADAPPTAAVAAEPPPAALRHARQAVAYGPDSVDYREYLAMLLASTNDLDGAAAVLHHPTTAAGLLLGLIDDLRLIGLPPEAEPDPLLGGLIMMGCAMAAADAGPDTRGSEVPELRCRGWSTPAALDEVEQYYRERLPGARFFASDDGTALGELASGWGEQTRVALFTLAPEGWVALTNPAEVEQHDPETGSWLQLVLLPTGTYARWREADVGASWPGAGAGAGPRVGILFMNGRRAS